MSILAEILAHKRSEVDRAKASRPLAAVRDLAGNARPPRGLTRALRREPGQPIRVIAEVKRASPSAGAIRPGADAAVVARGYRDGGAAAISVLTDQVYFDGHLSFLTAVADAVDRPVLRKDFIIDPYQVVEARAAGADGLLLIVSALSDAALAELLAQTRELGMDALVEVHDEAEARRAVSAGADLLGVNHRNLKTFEIDMQLTARLSPLVPDGTVLVGESGIRTGSDMRMLAEAGAHAVLIGEQLMRAEDPGRRLAELLAEAHP